MATTSSYCVAPGRDSAAAMARRPRPSESDALIALPLIGAGALLSVKLEHARLELDRRAAGGVNATHALEPQPHEEGGGRMNATKAVVAEH